jgi:hypothetical protein
MRVAVVAFDHPVECRLWAVPARSALIVEGPEGPAYRPLRLCAANGWNEPESGRSGRAQQMTAWSPDY